MQKQICSLFLSILTVATVEFAQAAPAQDEIQQYILTCGTESSSIKIWIEGEKVFFRYDDLMGFKNFPLYEGVLTMPMVPYVDKWTKELSVFDGHSLASWPRNKCKFDRNRPLLVLCSGRGEILAPGGVAFTTSGVSTLIESSERLDLAFERLKVNWGLDTNSEPNKYFHYFVTFPFMKQNCQARLK